MTKITCHAVKAKFLITSGALKMREWKMQEWKIQE